MENSEVAIDLGIKCWFSNYYHSINLYHEFFLVKLLVVNAM